MPLWLSIPCAVIAWFFVITGVINGLAELLPAYRVRRFSRRHR
jgi:hypothetical protein